MYIGLHKYCSKSMSKSNRASCDEANISYHHTLTQYFGDGEKWKTTKLLQFENTLDQNKHL